MIVRIFGLVACFVTIGCTWSDPHRMFYTDCMRGMHTYEQALVGTKGKLMPLGIDPTDYCWQQARSVTRNLEKRRIFTRTNG